jgi:hypothetical protein
MEPEFPGKGSPKAGIKISCPSTSTSFSRIGRRPSSRRTSQACAPRGGGSAGSAAASRCREISEQTGRDFSEVRRIVEEELGLEDAEPVVLTFEIPGDTEASRAAEMLAERSSTPQGLATGLYGRVEDAMRQS